MLVATNWLNRSAGVPHARTRRGRPLSLRAISLRWSWPWTLKSVPLGRSCRASPFQFSLVGRCQGECGSQKNTGVRGQPNDMPSDAPRDMFSGLVVEFDQHLEPGRSLDERGHRAGAVGADGQVAFPASLRSPVMDLLRRRRTEVTHAGPKRDLCVESVEKYIATTAVSASPIVPLSLPCTTAKVTPK